MATKIFGEVLEVKTGKARDILFGNDKETIKTAIKKKIVDEAYITQLGPKGDEVGLREHHGGINKGHGGKTMQEMETPFIIAGKNVKKGGIFLIAK